MTPRESDVPTPVSDSGSPAWRMTGLIFFAFIITSILILACRFDMKEDIAGLKTRITELEAQKATTPPGQVEQVVQDITLLKNWQNDTDNRINTLYGIADSVQATQTTLMDMLNQQDILIDHYGFLKKSQTSAR